MKTTKIETMDRAACRLVSEAIARALEASAELKALGVVARTRGASYDPRGGLTTVKVEAGLVTESGEVASRESAAWKSAASLFDLPADGLGRSFRLNGRTWKVTGLKPAARKMPVCVQGDDGRSYKMGADTVRLALQAAPVAP